MTGSEPATNPVDPRSETVSPQPNPGSQQPHTDFGGDPVCWLTSVCPECGRFVEDNPPTTCPRCGTAIPEPD
ncbi:MAG TPA: hypothetical protein VHX38_05930 [Pseudonocardiaceae bacterium]|jgi:rubrerythrin|nr:hypothetical protein [Pseudonocardiaceae bacterium]